MALADLNKQFPEIKPVFFQNKNISTFEKDSAYSVLYLMEDLSVGCSPDKEVTKENDKVSCGTFANFTQPANETAQPLPSFTGYNEKGFALVAESMKQKTSAGSKFLVKSFTGKRKIPNFELPEAFVNKYVTAHEIARLISKYMPQGMYIYLSALNEKINGKEVKFPQMILDHGEVLYFVKPKK